jgi:hypothetical protein
MNPLSTSYGLREGSGEAQVFEKSSFDPVESFKKTEDEIRKAGLAKKEQKDADLASIGDVDVSGMDIDIQRELVGDKKNLISMVQDYYSKGMDPFDSDNEEAFFKVRQAMSGLKNKVAISGNHRDYNAKILTALNSKDADKKYDLEASKKNYNKWRNMSVQDRVGMDPSSILVAKPEFFDANKYVNDVVTSRFPQLTETKQSERIGDDGKTVKVKVKELSLDKLQNQAALLNKDERFVAAVNDDYLANADKYNGREDYILKNYLKDFAKKEVIQDLEGSSSTVNYFGGSKQTPQQLEERHKNLETLIKAFYDPRSKKVLNNPTTEAKKLGALLIDTKMPNGTQVKDVSFGHVSGLGSDPIIRLQIVKPIKKTTVDGLSNYYEYEDIGTEVINLKSPDAYLKLSGLMSSNTEGAQKILGETLQSYNQSKGRDRVPFYNVYANRLQYPDIGTEQLTDETTNNEGSDVKSGSLEKETW